MPLSPCHFQTFRVKLGSHWSEDDGFVEGDDLTADASLPAKHADDEEMA
jgi:hypothetical protein